MQCVRERVFKLQQQKKDDDNTSSDEDSIAPDNEEKDVSNDEKKVDDADIVTNNDKDATNDEDKDENANTFVNNDDEVTYRDGDGDDSDVPDDHMFASYFAFIAWVPFAPMNDRLEMLMTSDDKKVAKSTTATRKVLERKNKDEVRAHASSALRGFSTEQSVNID